MNTLKQFINQNHQTREYLVNYKIYLILIKFFFSQKLNYFYQSKNSNKKIEQNPFMKIAQQKQFQQNQTQVPNQFLQLVAHQPTSQIQTSSFGSGFGQILPKASEPSLFNLAISNQALELPKSSRMETNFFSNIAQMNTKPPNSNMNTFFGKNLPLTIKEDQMDNNLYYSQVNEINKQDLDEFKSNNFTIGRIPSVPPAKEFC